MTNDDTTPRIGLALSGGAVLGAAHVGVLRVLEEEGIRTGWVAGTSAGAVIGALHAFGTPAQKIESLIRELSWLNVGNLRPSRLGLFSIARLGEFLIEALGDVDVEDSPLPLVVVATDIHTGERRRLRQGKLARAVMASACIPGIFAPVSWDGRLLVDGGIAEHLPIDAAHHLGAERVVGVDLHTAGLYPQPKTVIDVVLNASNILMHNTSRVAPGEGEIIVTPQLTAYSVVDTGHVPELIEEGRRAARAAIEDIRALLG